MKKIMEEEGKMIKISQELGLNRGSVSKYIKDIKRFLGE